jgi:orotidine-5'-phosphate decarboxylase
MRTLGRLVAEARGAGLLVVLDVKRGDVGSTNDAYAEAFLGQGAPFQTDALTVHPYLGIGAMGAFIERARHSGACVLVVTHSSNPEGRPIQTALAPCGRSVEQLLLDEIARLNDALAPGAIGPVGAVVSPARDGTGVDLDLRAAHALFLAPGLGAQGATVDDVARVFAACPDRVMPSASRSLLDRGPDLHRLKDTIAALAAELRDALAVS